MSAGNCITTYTGISFNPLDPKVHEISTTDIGHALSLICRANGHCRNFYSVAQHSLNCTKEARKRGYSERLQLACLLHDASEAYISDITRPVKRHLTNYLEVEKKLQRIIFTAYGLSDLTLIKEIDDAMLEYEMETLMNTHVSSGRKLVGQYNLKFTMMHDVEEEFIRLAEKLQEEINFSKGAIL